MSEVLTYDDATASVAHLLPDTAAAVPPSTLCLWCRHRRDEHYSAAPGRCVQEGCKSRPGRCLGGFKPHPQQVPCPTGFHWIGQAFGVCDSCPFPAWEHAGVAELKPNSPLIGREDSVWQLRPWREGEAERVRAKWEGYSS